MIGEGGCWQIHVMSEHESLPEIERFLDRLGYSCSEPEYVSYRQKLLREWVTHFADVHGEHALRNAALARLAEPDPRAVERALSCLFVVGCLSDVSAIEELNSHSDLGVRKAARTCLFEIRQRGSTA